MSHLALVLALLLAPAAWAGPVEDLALAADSTRDETTRMAAYSRVVAAGATDTAHVLAVAADDSADTRLRWVAIRALGEIGGDAAKTTLLTQLGAKRPAIRAAAASALGDLGDRNTVTQLTDALSDDAVIVRAAAAEALGKLAHGDAVPALAAALESQDNYYRGSSLWVRKHYVVALGLIGDKDAVPALLRALDDADSGVSAAAVDAFEAVAGFSFESGRNETEEVEAWRRWGAAQVKVMGG